MKIDTSTKIGEVVREQRRSLGMSQGELAARLGVSGFVLCRIEHSKRRFDTDWIPLMPAPMRAAVKAALVDRAQNIRETPRPRRAATSLKVAEVV